VSFALFIILCIPTAVVDNFGGLCVLRFLLGFFGSPCLATGAASLQDMVSCCSLRLLALTNDHKVVVPEAAICYDSLASCSVRRPSLSTDDLWVRCPSQRVSTMAQMVIFLDHPRLLSAVSDGQPGSYYGFPAQSSSCYFSFSQRPRQPISCYAERNDSGEPWTIQSWYLRVRSTKATSLSEP
jgi:hypothetical protein